MTELELYKYISENGTMTSYDGDKAIVWIYHFELLDFVKLLGRSVLRDGGIEVRLQDDYVAIDMTEICDYYNIDIKNVFGDEH